MKLDELRELYRLNLLSMRDAERQWRDALNSLAHSASRESVRQAFLQLKDEADWHVGRLERMLSISDSGAVEGNSSGAAAALLKSCFIAGEIDALDPEVRDAALLASALKMSHYGIAGYGALARWAEMVGANGDLEALEKTLDEEHAADRMLSALSDESMDFRMM